MFWAILWFLVIVAVVATVAAIAINKQEEVEEVAKPHTTFEFSEKSGYGAPLFANVAGRKPLMRHIEPRAKVWALTPHGPQKMTVEWVEGNATQLSNEDYIVDAVFDDDYLSTTVANKLSHHCGAWRVGMIQKRLGEEKIGIKAKYTDEDRWENRRWIEDETVFGIDDFFDVLIFYEFMFDDFSEPLDHYQDSESTWDVPPLVEEPPLDEGEPFEPYQPSQEEPVDVDPIPDPVAEVEPEPIVESTPKPVVDTYTPPAPEPSSYDSGGYSVGGDD